MSVTDLITQVRATPDCIVYPSNGIPTVQDGFNLPRDIRDFYQQCGGAKLYEHGSFPVEIVPPQEFVIASPVIYKDMLDDETVEEIKDEISWSWYLIGKGQAAQFITIDLRPERLGYCYDSDWVVHPADSTIVALSFTELLQGLFSDQGGIYYWAKPGYKPYGPAYV